MTASPAPVQRAERRRRILFVAEAVTLAHVARPAVLAQALDPVQYEVHFAVDPRYERLFPALPGPPHPIRSIPTAQFLHALATGQPVYDYPTLRGYVEADLALLREVQPDLVVGDFRLSLSVSARVAGVPYATITNAYWSPYAKVRFTIPEHPLVKVLGVAAANTLFRTLRPAIFALHAIPMNRVCGAYGLRGPGPDLRQVYTEADYTLYADVPGLVEMHDLPPNHQFLGPILWSPPVPSPSWWNDLPADKPIVYVTLGSSGARDLLPVVLAGLAELPVAVIAATAGGLSPAAVPANAWVADYLPGVEAAQRASLVICNGGSPTTQQALAAGKPVLGIASNLDQYLNMDGIVRAGAGALLRSGQMPAGLLWDTVGQLLHSGAARHAAQRLADASARADAGARVQAVLRHMLAREPADARG